MNRWTKLVAVVLMLGLIASCGQPSGLSSLLDNYHYRLSNTFEFDYSDKLLVIDEDVLPRYPTRRQLHQPLSPVSVNLLEFLRLSRCDLQRLIGERNSSLGKVMADSQAWMYHLRFIALAETCSMELQAVGNASLAQAVVDARQIKINDLPHARWNALLASQEFQQLFSHAAKPLNLAEATGNSAALIQALQQLLQLLKLGAEDPLPDFSELENHYAIIGSDKFMGRLLRSQTLLTQTLTQLSDEMVQANQQHPLCPAGTLTPRGRVMQQVFLRFYVGEIQPYISGVYRQSRDLKQALEAYWLLWPALKHVEFDRYWHRAWSDSNPDSTWQQFNRAVARHTQVWQQQLESCGLRPGHDRINGK